MAFQQELLQRMISSLSEKHRPFFTFYYMDELSQEEIAARLGTTANAVKCALRIIRQSLRDQFAAELAALGLHNS